MKLHAPVPCNAKEISKPVTVDGVTFPNYTKFSVSINSLHHNPHVWSEDLIVIFGKVLLL